MLLHLIDFFKIYFTSWPQFTPFSPSSPSPHLFMHPQSALPQFLFRKDQASHGYKKHMAYQDAVR